MSKTDTPHRRTRGKKARRRTMLDTEELRWKAGKEPREATVTGRPMNPRLLSTDLGIVRVTDSRPFQKGLKIPVWIEPDSGKLFCKGRPKQLDRY